VYKTCKKVCITISTKHGPWWVIVRIKRDCTNLLVNRSLTQVMSTMDENGLDLKRVYRSNNIAK